jgi:hypothetical protein
MEKDVRQPPLLTLTLFNLSGMVNYYLNIYERNIKWRWVSANVKECSG